MMSCWRHFYFWYSGLITIMWLKIWSHHKSMLRHSSGFHSFLWAFRNELVTQRLNSSRYASRSKEVALIKQWWQATVCVQHLTSGKNWAILLPFQLYPLIQIGQSGFALALNRWMRLIEWKASQAFFLICSFYVTVSWLALVELKMRDFSFLVWPEIPDTTTMPVSQKRSEQSESAR